ncbi:MAG: hypothetical protein HPY50_02380 [Firmicutes bacterium]|nr:hypothetical protein [Bacillota bacterium]
MLKKTLLILLCCLMVLTYNVEVVNTAGVPVFQCTVSPATTISTTHASPTSYDWTTTTPACSDEGGCINYYQYYKVLLISSNYFSTDYYITSYNLTVTALRNSTTSWVAITIQGRNSANDTWVDIDTVSLNSGQSTTINRDLRMTKQIRIIGVGGDKWINSGGGRFSGTFNSYALSLVSADQNTVELARQAAVNASVSAQNAYTAVYDDVADKSVIDYVKAIEQKVNNASSNVSITKVQGQGGATCTSTSSFTAVVSVSPETGATLTATCTGPSSPSVVVSGNKVTFSGLNSPGAYTATIRATIGTTTSSYSHTFFRI